MLCLLVQSIFLGTRMNITPSVTSGWGMPGGACILDKTGLTTTKHRQSCKSGTARAACSAQKAKGCNRSAVRSKRSKAQPRSNSTVGLGEGKDQVRCNLGPNRQSAKQQCVHA